MKTETILTVATLGLAAVLIASVARRRTPALSPLDAPVTFAGAWYGGDPSSIFTGFGSPRPNPFMTAAGGLF